MKEKFKQESFSVILYICDNEAHNDDDDDDVVSRDGLNKESLTVSFMKSWWAALLLKRKKTFWLKDQKSSFCE